MEYFIYLIPALGIIGLAVMAFKAMWVTRQDSGDDKMVRIADHIASGAMSFLKAEWRVLAIFVVFAGALLGWSGTQVEHSSWIIAVTFVIGAVFSATAGYIGIEYCH